MQKKIVTIALFAILLLSISAVFTVTTRAATEEEIEHAIETGVAWLAGKQSPIDGSWDGSVAITGLAVVKFETHAIRNGIDPLDPSYQYYAQVRNGLDYIFLNAWKISIGMQPAGNPDTDGDGIGVHWYDSTYFTGIAMMAIAASTHPEMTVNVVGSAVNGWTYKEVVQDAVDYLSWGQTDIGGSWRGGWYYSHMDNNPGGADNSNSGYAVLGLAYAEAGTIDGKTGFGCTIPAFVRSELNIWIDYIQNDVNGGSGYQSPDYWVNVLKTGNLCFEMAFYGDDTTVQRVKDAVDYIDLHWNDADYIGWRGPGPGGDPNWPACYQAMYCIMKGLEILNIEYISPLNDPTGIDWFDDLANVLIAQQNIDGSWPNAPLFGAPDGSVWNWDWDQILSTEWALLTLQKVVPLRLTPGKVTGGGQIAITPPGSKTGKASFGFNVMYQEGDPAPKGELQYVDHTTKMIVHSHDMTSLVVSPDKTKATFAGTCTIDGVSGFTFKVYVEDNSEPGKTDFFKITLSTDYSAGGVLLNGNIQIHKKP